MQKFKMMPYLVVFSAALFFCYELVQMHMLNAISSYLLRDLKIGATEFGTLSATYLLADVIFLLPAGIILDRFSARRVILMALFLCIFGTVGFALSQTLWNASIFHFLSGIGNAFCFLSCMILVSRWFPAERQALIVGLVVTVGLLGGVLAQTPLSLLAEAFNWRNALLIDAMIGVVIFLLAFLFVRDRPKDQVAEESSAPVLPFWEGVRRSVFNRHNLLCGTYTGLMNLPIMVIGAVWGSLYLTQIHHLSMTEAAFATGMICMGTIVGSPIVGHLSDRSNNRRQWMLLGAVASFTVMALILFMPPSTLTTMALLFFLLGFFTSSQVLGYPAITQNNPPELTGTSMGVAAVIIMGVAAIAQPLSGSLMELNWNGQMADGAPLYATRDFVTAFIMFPIGFVISFVAALRIREKVSQLSGVAVSSK